MTDLHEVTIRINKTTYVRVYGEPTDSPYLYVTPAMHIDDDGCLRLSDELTLTHTPTGLRLPTESAWALREIAKRIAPVIDWSFTDMDHFLKEENKDDLQKVSAVYRDFHKLESDDSWPWPKWAGDESTPALSLLVKLLDDLVRPYDERRKWRDEYVEKFMAETVEEQRKKLDSLLLARDCANDADAYGIVWLTAVLQRADPDLADRAVRLLVDAWEAGDVIGEWTYQWRGELAANKPLKLPGIPGGVAGTLLDKELTA